MSVLDFQPPFPDRKADVLAFYTNAPFRLTKVVQTLLDRQGGQATVGIQKLAQQVIIRLFTALGGKPYENREGCQLMTEIYAGAVHIIDDARRAFEQSREDVLDQFAEDVTQDPSIPADEQVYDLQWLGGSLEGDFLYMQLRLISQAGEDLQFIMPVPVSS